MIDMIMLVTLYSVVLHHVSWGLHLIAYNRKPYFSGVTKRGVFFSYNKQSDSNQVGIRQWLHDKVNDLALGSDIYSVCF